MLITQVKTDYTRPPALRNLDDITKQTVSILFCSENKAVIDIGNLDIEHKSQGYFGFRYHYVIKNNSPFDGTVYYCRPRIFQNGVDGSVDTLTSNSISILLAGAKGQKLTEGQIESSISLVIYLISQENLPLSSVKFYQTLVGVADIPNWQDLMTRLKDRVANINRDKGLIDLPTTENGLLDTSQFGTIISNNYLNTVARISIMTGIPQNILIDMNKTISFGTNIPPDTVVYIPKGDFLQRMIDKQQYDAARNITNRIEQEFIIAKEIADKRKNLEFDITEDLTTLTTQYGGKKAPPWFSEGLELPGYHSAFVQIYNTVEKRVETTIGFNLSPSSSSEARSNSQQMTKTNAGWFIQRTGKNPTNLTISGYMMDARGILEKHDFLEKYKAYIEDSKNVRFEYSNPYTVKIRLEGRDFYGYIQGISFSRNANQPYLYQYNITFLILNDKMIYDSSQAAKSANEIERLRGTGQYQSIPRSNNTTPGQTPRTSGTVKLPNVSRFSRKPRTVNIAKKIYNTVKEADVDMNMVTPISYTPSIANPGRAT